MQASSVPMSGPGMYSVRLAIARAKDRTRRSLAARPIAGSAQMPALPPPKARPAAAFFNVIARARRATSVTVTSGAIRTPPTAGPAARLSTTTTACRPAAAPEQQIFAGPRSSHSSPHRASITETSLAGTLPSRRASARPTASSSRRDGTWSRLACWCGFPASTSTAGPIGIVGHQGRVDGALGPAWSIPAVVAAGRCRSRQGPAQRVGHGRRIVHGEAEPVLDPHDTLDARDGPCQAGDLRAPPQTPSSSTTPSRTLTWIRS